MDERLDKGRAEHALIVGVAVAVGHVRLMLFAVFDALRMRRLQSDSGLFGISVPYQMCLMLPCALSVTALVLVARHAAYPQALMKPYRKGER